MKSPMYIYIYIYMPRKRTAIVIFHRGFSSPGWIAGGYSHFHGIQRVPRRAVHKKNQTTLVVFGLWATISPAKPCKFVVPKNGTRGCSSTSETLHIIIFISIIIESQLLGVSTRVTSTKNSKCTPKYESQHFADEISHWNRHPHWETWGCDSRCGLTKIDRYISVNDMVQ